MNELERIAYDRLRKVVANTLELAPESVTPETARGLTLGWDSIGHLALMMEIEHEFGVRFSTEQLGQVKTVGDLWTMLEGTRTRP